MKTYLFIVFKGGTRFSGVLYANNYSDAKWAVGAAGFPPSYIWSIEPQ